CYWIGRKEVMWDRAADGYRLLTEAEWEYACRARSTTRWSFGDDQEKLEKHAWYRNNSQDEPRPVGQKEPNAWGLYDMHGNVYEWAWIFSGSYAETAETDPIGPPKGIDRVLRGGAFGSSPGILRSADRGRNQPTDSDWFIGFRCARGQS